MERPAGRTRPSQTRSFFRSFPAWRFPMEFEQRLNLRQNMLSQTSFLRKSLAPLSLIYAGFSALHAHVFLRPGPRNGPPLLPFIVIGALRAGGSGKTAVTLELARRLSNRGRL